VVEVFVTTLGLNNKNNNPHFNGPCSRTTPVCWYQNVSILDIMSLFWIY